MHWTLNWNFPQNLIFCLWNTFLLSVCLFSLQSSLAKSFFGENVHSIVTFFNATFSLRFCPSFDLIKILTFCPWSIYFRNFIQDSSVYTHRSRDVLFDSWTHKSKWETFTPLKLDCNEQTMQLTTWIAIRWREIHRLDDDCYFDNIRKKSIPFQCNDEEENFYFLDWKANPKWN